MKFDGKALIDDENVNFVEVIYIWSEYMARKKST